MRKVSDGHIPEETFISTQEIVRPRPYHPSLPQCESTDRKHRSVLPICALTLREGRVVRSWTDYLLGTDKSLFRNVSVRYLTHNTDHYMVVGHLRSATARDHTRYIKGRRKMMLKPPTEPTREDGHRPTSGGGPKHGLRSGGERQEGFGDCDGDDGGRGRGYDGTLPSEETTMGKRTPDMEHGEGGKGGKVLDGLSPGY